MIKLLKLFNIWYYIDNNDKKVWGKIVKYSNNKPIVKSFKQIKIN